MKRKLAALFCAVLTLSAEIVDRVAIRIGNQVITELQVDEELRVTALLNRKPVLRDAGARRDAADRLIEQFMLRREMELSRYPSPDASEVQSYHSQIESELGGPASLSKSLHDYALTEDALEQHLSLQLAVLQFIAYRFRSDLSVTDADIEAYYQREAAQAKATHTALPLPLEASKDSIRQILIEERTDEALSAWLEEARKRFNIVYLDASLQ